VRSDKIRAMDARTKREIRRLVNGWKDPRRGFGRTRIGRVVPDHGPVFLMLLAFPIFGPLVLVLLWLFEIPGMLVGNGLMLAFMFWTLALLTLTLVRTSRLCKAHECQLCLWCHHPISGLGARGVCPECGAGFDLGASVALWRDTMIRHQPSLETRSRRLRYAWARAVRERDRTPNGPRA